MVVVVVFTLACIVVVVLDFGGEIMTLLRWRFDEARRISEWDDDDFDEIDLERL